MNRRTVLAAVGAGTAVIAGCIGDGNGGEDDAGSGGGNGADSETDGESGANGGEGNGGANGDDGDWEAPELDFDDAACDPVGTYFFAIHEGEYEAAVQYFPHEYLPNRDESSAIRTAERLGDELTGNVEDVSCSTGEEAAPSEIELLDQQLDGEVTGYVDVAFSIALADGSEVTDSRQAIEIDGDWYLLY